MNESLMRAVYHDDTTKGPGTMVDLTRGHEYTIRVRQGMFGRIFVDPCHGFDNKPYVDMTMRYPSLHHFFHDWQPRALLHDKKLIYNFKPEETA